MWWTVLMLGCDLRSEPMAEPVAAPVPAAAFVCPATLDVLMASLIPESPGKPLPPSPDDALACGDRQGDRVPLHITTSRYEADGWLRLDELDQVVELSAGGPTGAGHLRLAWEQGRVAVLATLGGPTAQVHHYGYDEAGRLRSRALWFTMRGHPTLREVVDLDEQGRPVRRRQVARNQLTTIHTTWEGEARTDREPVVGPVEGLPGPPPQLAELVAVD